MTLSNRVAKELVNPDLANMNVRQLAIKLAEKFWREDNPLSRFSEPPSTVYELMEKTIKAQAKGEQP